VHECTGATFCHTYNRGRASENINQVGDVCLCAIFSLLLPAVSALQQCVFVLHLPTDFLIAETTACLQWQASRVLSAHNASSAEKGASHTASE
jgi:hypothetical protein